MLENTRRKRILGVGKGEVKEGYRDRTGADLGKMMNERKRDRQTDKQASGRKRRTHSNLDSNLRIRMLMSTWQARTLAG